MKRQIRGHIQHLNWAPNAERQKLKSASSRGRPDFAGLWGRNKNDSTTAHAKNPTRTEVRAASGEIEDRPADMGSN